MNTETIPQTEIDKPVKRLFASDAERIMKPEKEVTLPDYERGTFEKAYVGALDTITAMGDLPESIEIFGDRISYGFSQYFGSDIKDIDRKKSNLVTAERNLLNQQKERGAFKSPEETGSLSYAIGSGAVSYGSMLFTSGLGYIAGLEKASATGLGITSMTAQEFPSQVSARTPIKDGELDLEKITPEWARKTTASQIGYHASSAILERTIGLGQQLNTWTKPIQLSSEVMSTVASAAKRIGTSAIKSGVSEGITEGTQSLASSGFLLADGTIDMSQMPDQIKSAMKDAVVGGLLGTAAGTAVGINQRANVLKSLHEIVDPVFGDIKIADAVVNEIYKTGTAEMTTVISKELELSSELTSKHGLIMDNMGKAIHEAINTAGAFENVPETEVAEHVMDTSKLFADQVLAEANKRSVLIDGILSGSQITFKDGKIQLANGENVVAENEIGDVELPKFKNITFKEYIKQNKIEQDEDGIFPFIREQAKQIADNIKNPTKQQGKRLINFIKELGGIYDVGGELKNKDIKGDIAKKEQNDKSGKRRLEIDNLIELAFDKGYFPEKSSANDITHDEMIDLIEKDYHGEKVFPDLQINKNRENNTKYFNQIDEIGISQQDSEDVIAQKLQQYFLDNDIPIKDVIGEEPDYIKNVPMDNFELYQSAYHGTPEFKSWFGDSKVVDADGKPLVVYHGTTADFGEFSKDKSSTESDLGAGFYFTNNVDDVGINYAGEGPDLTNKIQREAERIADETERDYNDPAVIEEAKKNVGVENGGATYPVYLSMKNPIYIGGDNNSFIEGGYVENYEPYMDEAAQILDEEVGIGEYTEEDQISRAKIIADENGDVSVEGGVAGLIDAIANMEDEFSDIDVGKLRGDLDYSVYEGMYADELIQKLKSSEGLMYATDNETGNLVSNEVIRRAFEDLGYDGFIDSTVSEKFKKMQGMDEDTKHYIVFNPEQIKSTFNQGTFDPNDPRILYQGNKKGSFSVSQQAIELTKDADFSTLPHEFAHYWLTNMYDFTRTGKASEAYLKNFEAVKNYLGITDNQKFLTREQQEKFATGYEKYLRQGSLPNRIIGQLYDDYDKWLKRVYAQVPRNRLTPEMVEFFKTMTTGQLIEPSGYEPTPELIRTTKERIAKDGQEVITARQADIAENVVIPTTTEYKPVEINRVPITSDNQTGESAVFKKHAEEMGSNAQLKYDVANMEEQAKLADEYLKSNPQDAVDVVYGRKEPPKNILANSIRNAYIKQMLEIGNNEEYIKALKIQSFELTRAGQEIASQRGVVKDIYDPTGWIMQVIEGRKQNISENYDKIVDKAISDNIGAIQSKETVEEQQKEINRVIKSVAKELGAKPDELYQTLNEKLTGKNSIYTAMRTQVDDALGVNLTKEEAGKLIAQTDSLKKNALNSIDKNGNPSVEFFRILNDTEKLANSLNPTNPVAILTSIVGRGNMLASIKSLFLNIESNFLNSVTERLTRRAVLKLTSDVKIDNQVSPELAKQYMKYSSDVYKASGYTVSGMFEIDPKADFKGEKFMHSQGTGVIRKIGQMVEQTVFKYSLGYNDRYMKDLAFVDSAGLEATKQARIENAKDVKARANEIFQDAIKIEPKTAQGVKIREIAVNEALVATYMNNTKLASWAIQIRDLINQSTGVLRVGDLISPFVKTPANVVSLGLEYSLGGVQALKNLDVIVNDFKTGNITDTTRNAIRSTSRNALGLVASMLIMAGFIDDEDYIPDYSVLSPAERKMVQQKNGVFNSIRIGNKYISLDYFGALAAPLVAALEFRRAKGLTEGLFGYGKGVALQVMKLPVIGDLKDIYADISTNLTRTGDKTFEGLGEWGVDLLSARAIPAFVNDIAKQLDTYERDTGGSALNRAISKIPVLRENLPPKYNFVTGEPVKVEAYNFLFGARLKTGNFSSEMSQIESLVEGGNNITLSDPTRYGKLKDLPEVDKIRIRAEFADDYSSAITKEMEKGSWDKKSNEDKAKTLNELRSKILKKYKN